MVIREKPPLKGVAYGVDGIIPLVSIPKISSPYPTSVAAQAGLSLTWSEIPKTGFLVMWLIWYIILQAVCSKTEGLFMWPLTFNFVMAGRTPLCRAIFKIRPQKTWRMGVQWGQEGGGRKGEGEGGKAEGEGRKGGARGSDGERERENTHTPTSPPPWRCLTCMKNYKLAQSP